jgi:rhodanese-related sulfurtransferase
MKLVNVLLATALLAGASVASEFKSYSDITKELRAAEKKAGNFATTDEVKAALKAKDWIVADARTVEEWNAAHIKGSQRIGRQAPEKALPNFVLDLEDNFVKDKMILVCNSAARASIEAETYRKMGFKTVKIYDLYSWIDECNGVVNRYTKKSDKKGTKNKFGMFYAEHCKK